MIHLNSRDSRPIYEQIMEELRHLIISGGLAVGDRLPSVREQAARLAINPNTIQRAYRELELSGYVITLPGKGVFVAEAPVPDSARLRSLWEQLDRAVAELRFGGVSEQELLAHLRKGAST